MHEISNANTANTLGFWKQLRIEPLSLDINVKAYRSKKICYYYRQAFRSRYSQKPYFYLIIIECLNLIYPLGKYTLYICMFI